MVIAGMYVLLWGKSKDEETCNINIVPKRIDDGNNNPQESPQEITTIIQ